jgi:hypothetical protein
MKMLMLTYGGSEPERVTALLEDAGVPGHTCFEGGKGHGLTGPRENTRAWPGTVTVCYAVVEDEVAVAVGKRCRAAKFPPGERLHIAVLPVESFC